MKSRLPLFKFTQLFNFSKRTTPIKRVQESYFPLHEQKDFIHTSKLRKQKTKLMTYNDNCKPFWMKIKSDDPFDYKLRSKEEVYYQMFVYPPFWNVNISYFMRFEDLLTKASSDGNQYNKIRLYVKIKDMNLFPLQQQRLIFLLGRRYKNNGILKLVCQQTDNLETNVAIARDTLKQLYLEALRAPIYLTDWMNKDEYDEFFSQYGESPEEGKNALDSLFFNKESSDYKEFLRFYSVVGNSEVSYEAKLKEWSKVVLERFESYPGEYEEKNKTSNKFVGLDENDLDNLDNEQEEGMELEQEERVEEEEANIEQENLPENENYEEVEIENNLEDGEVDNNNDDITNDDNINELKNVFKGDPEFENVIQNIDEIDEEHVRKIENLNEKDLEEIKRIIMEESDEENSAEDKKVNQLDDVDKYKIKDRESAYYGLIHKGILTEKAYEMFIKDKK